MAEVRASYCKAAVAAVKRHRRAPALLTRLEPVRDVVRQATNLGWVDARHFVEITRATLHVLGAQEAQRFWADRLGAALNRPLMRPLAQGGMFLYGNDPASIIRMTPRAYPLVFKDCGTPRVVVGDGSVRLSIREMPDSVRDPGIATCFGGHCVAAVEFAGARGEVLIDDQDLTNAGRLELITHWS